MSIIYVLVAGVFRCMISHLTHYQSHIRLYISNTRFHDSTIPVFEQLEKSDIPIYNLDGTQSPDEVWNELLVKCPQIQSREMRYRDAA